MVSTFYRIWKMVNCQIIEEILLAKPSSTLFHSTFNLIYLFIYSLYFIYLYMLPWAPLLAYKMIKPRKRTFWILLYDNSHNSVCIVTIILLWEQKWPLELIKTFHPSMERTSFVTYEKMLSIQTYAKSMLIARNTCSDVLSWVTM